MELLEKNNHYLKHVKDQNKTDKEIRHKYISLFYEEHFLPYKDQEITLLEIGISHGSSLILWNDYFEKAYIIGADVTDMTMGSAEPYPRIQTHFISGYEKSFVDSLPPLDIVVDDGPHTLENQQSCMDLYIPKIKAGGLLVIEDIKQHNIDALEAKAKTMNLNYKIFNNIGKTTKETDDSIILGIWL